MMQGWKDVHARVKRMRRDRAALDHAELAVLRDVVTFRVWKELSYSTVIVPRARARVRAAGGV